MKYVILVLDGAADYPVRGLGGKTPLMAARKPNIDLLARKGRCGMFRTIPARFNTGSAVGNLSIMGYDPRKVFQGRGVLEAAAMGIKLENHDVALRCNTLCIKDGKIKNHSAGHISDTESHELIRALDQALGNDKVKFYPGVSYRHVLVLKGRYNTAIKCMAPHDHVGESVAKMMVKATSKAGEETAALLNKLMMDSKMLLEKHPVNMKRMKEGKDPANMIWPWSPGKRPHMRLFREMYNKQGAVISAVDLIKGIAVYAGMDVINVEGATGLYNTNYEGKADACIEALEDHDLLYLHVEACDEASHEGNLKLKIKCIEDFDKRLLSRVLEKLRAIKDDVRVAVLPDHPTPVELGKHVDDPVPFAIYDRQQKPDNVQAFDELSCAKGSYGLLEGDAFIRELFKDTAK